MAGDAANDPARPRIAVLAPLGWSVRNWVVSRFLAELAAQAEVTVFTPAAKNLAALNRVPGVTFEWMDVRPLGRWSNEVSVLMTYAHFYRQRTHIQLSALRRSQPAWPWNFRLRRALTKALARFVLAPLPEALLSAIERTCFGLGPETRRIEALLRARRIGLVFSTMPLIAHFERPALWAARRLGVPVACFISSWDNLHSKGRLPIAFDHYLLWSDQMRSDLLERAPRVRRADTTVVGTPQFDFYREREGLASRADFLRSIGGDPARQLILWSAASIGQAPNEPLLLEAFCAAAREGRLHGNPQILVRPHPIGGGARFARVRERFPEVLFTETNATDPGNLINWTPGTDDEALLVNSIAHADVNINHCSTMTIDCCAMDRPVVNLAYDVEPGSEMETYVRNCYQYEHYRSVTALGAVRLANSHEELIGQVNEYLKNPALDAPNRAALVKHWCGEIDGQAARRAARCLLVLARPGTPAEPAVHP